MNDSGFGSSSFSVATTVFVSLAICAIISYGVFYYFKQRISVIEQSQMEQARILQSFIARSIMHQQQPHQHHQPHQPHQPQDGNQLFQEHLVHKEVTITESGLIEVSSDSESESETETDSESSDSESESESESESTSSDSSSDHDDNNNESGSSEIKHIQIQLLPDDAVIAADDVIDASTVVSTKKIISLNKTAAIGNTDDESDDNDGESESDSVSDHPDQSSSLESLEPFELNIGYKAKTASKLHLNYGNMSVSALRQLVKERSLGGEDGDLQKLKKKDLVQLLTSNSI